MRYSMKRTAAIVIAVLLATPVWAEDGDGGYAGAQFQIPIGARPAGMGGAYLGVSDDGAGPLYNPAGIVSADHKLFATSYRVMDLDRKLGYLTFLLPTREKSVVGLNWHYFGSGSVQRRDSDGREIDGELSYNNHAVSALFAKRFEDYLSLGMRATYLHATFAEMASYSIGIDAGVMLYVSQLFDRDRREFMAVQDIRLGLVVKNIAAKYRWESGDYNVVYGGTFGSEQDDEVPLEVGLGGSARFLDRKLLVAADAYKNTEQDPRLHIGAEYFVVPELALRGGFSNGRLAAGTGYMFKFGRQMLAIDYAFSTDREDEGSEHIFSFDLLF